MCWLAIPTCSCSLVLVVWTRIDLVVCHSAVSTRMTRLGLCELGLICSPAVRSCSAYIGAAAPIPESSLYSPGQEPLLVWKVSSAPSPSSPPPSTTSTRRLAPRGCCTDGTDGLMRGTRALKGTWYPCCFLRSIWRWRRNWGARCWDPFYLEPSK